MSPITITFSTPTVPGFQWIDSFENLEDEAIEEILLHCRYATVAFEAELLHRHKPIVDLAFDDYCDLIGEQANKIRTSELTATNIKSLCDELDSFLSKDKREHHTLKPAQQYLEFISRVLGRSYALLIFCALGKTVQRLSQVQRAKLMKHMSTHRKVLFCDALEGEALHTRQQLCNQLKRKQDSPPSASGRDLQIRSPSAWYNLVMNSQRSCVENDGHSPGTNTLIPNLTSSNPIKTLTSAPCSSTIPPAILAQTVFNFQRLEDDLKELVIILVYLGEADISEIMLLRACKPRLFWNHCGEIESTSLNLVPVLADHDKLKLALHSLESDALITSKAGPLSYRSFSIDASLRMFIKNFVSSSPLRKTQASKLVLHTFPLDQKIDPIDYPAIGRSQLPQLQHVLTYFDAPDFANAFSVQELAHLVEICLSSSQLPGCGWKHKALATAKEILAFRLDDQQLLARLKLRERVLSQIFSDNFWGGNDHTNLTVKLYSGPMDVRSNAQIGEEILVQAQAMIDGNALTSAWRQLEQFKPLDSLNPSTQEQCVMSLILFKKAKVRRFSGDFLGAKEDLVKILDTKSKGSGISSRVMSQLAAIYCELGDIQTAMKVASFELKDPKFIHEYQVRRLKLSLADTHLATGLWTAVNTSKALVKTKCSGIWHFNFPENVTVCLKKAKNIYEEHLETCQIEIQSKVAKMEYLRTLAGLAIISQLEGQLEAASSYWKSASDTAEKCSSKPGFIEMIIAYSMIEIRLRLGDSNSVGLAQEAQSLFRITGRQFYFTMLGTVWPNLVGDLIECNGGCRIIPWLDNPHIETSLRV